MKLTNYLSKAFLRNNIGVNSVNGELKLSKKDSYQLKAEMLAKKFVKEKICFLKKHGYFIQAATEFEFIIKDKNTKQRLTLKEDSLRKMQDLFKSKSVKEIQKENVRGMGEVIFHPEPIRKYSTNFNSAMVNFVAGAAKQGYMTMGNNSDNDRDTPGVHLNFSIKNKLGENAVSNGSKLTKEGIDFANNLVDLLEDAPLFLVSNYQRIISDVARGSPKNVSIAIETPKFPMKSYGHSVLIRDIWDTDKARFELRLPDPSFNPDIANAFIVGVIAKTVEEQIKGIQNTKENTLTTGKKLLPKSNKEAYERFVNSRRLKGLFGSELHEAVADFYKQKLN